MSDLYFGTDLFSEFDRLQQQMAQRFGGFPSSIRASRFGTFPQINIGATDDSIEIVAFAPGVDAAALDVSIDKGLLTIGGERKSAQRDSGVSAHLCARALCRNVPAGHRAPRPPIPTRCRRTTKTGVYPSALASVNRPGRVPSLSSKRRSRS